MRTYIYKGQTTNYQITEDGRVFSNYSNKFLQPKIRNDGYIDYSIYIDSKCYTLSGHRMVAETYLPPSDSDKNIVHHIDSNKSNSHYLNLEWVTNGENLTYSYELGERDNSLSIYFFNENKELLGNFYSSLAASRALKISPELIQTSAKSERKKTLKGFYFNTTPNNTFETFSIPNTGSTKKPVGKFSIDGQLIESYISITEACQKNSCSKKYISNACHKVIKTYKGYIWNFL